MRQLLRHLARRRLRTTLTVAGVTIGIWALVVFGAMAERVDQFARGGDDYFDGRIVATAAGALLGNLPLPASVIDDIAAVEGVAAVEPQVVSRVHRGLSFILGLPSRLVGVEPALHGRVPRLRAGRWLTDADRGSNVLVLGADVAARDELVLGATVKIRETDFTVVGLLEPTLGLPDTEAYAHIDDARCIYYADLPELAREATEAGALVSQVIIYPDPDVDTAELAVVVKAAVPGLFTIGAKDYEILFGAATALLSALVVGMALVSLVVGGLSVANTMTMTVAERTREIGIRRAIGTTRATIVQDLVVESGFIGLVGGLAGLALGALTVAVAGTLMAVDAVTIFLLTPRLAAGAVVFALLLGAGAGMLPAVRAARLDPVEALRHA